MAALLAEPGFQIDCLDFLLGNLAPETAAAAKSAGRKPFSFRNCKFGYTTPSIADNIVE